MPLSRSFTRAAWACVVLALSSLAFAQTPAAVPGAEPPRARIAIDETLVQACYTGGAGYNEPLGVC